MCVNAYMCVIIAPLLSACRSRHAHTVIVDALPFCFEYQRERTMVCRWRDCGLPPLPGRAERCLSAQTRCRLVQYLCTRTSLPIAHNAM